MADLADFKLSDTLALGAEIRNLGTGRSTMEDVAQALVDHLRQRLPAPGGGSALVLARLYKTHAYQDIAPELQTFANKILGRDPDPNTKCLVLLGTRGQEGAWDSRKTSSGHKAIPLPDSEFVSRIPMVAEVFRQLGIDPSSLLIPDAAKLSEMERRQYDVFLVENAVDSAFIPAQDFVVKYRVQSVVAFGGVLPNGDLFVTLMFSSIPITRNVANLFAPLALSVKLALLPFYQARVFQ
jgi:hypothetical protein